MGSSWDELHCPFFYETCVATLGSYFSSEGFYDFHINPIGGIVFIKRDVFVEIEYGPEMAPNYDVRINVGFVSDVCQKENFNKFVPAWFLLKNNEYETNLLLNTFKTKEELETQLINLERDILSKHLKQCWADIEKLKVKVQEFAFFWHNKRVSPSE